MQKKEIIGLTKADKMLVTQVIEHFIWIEKELKNTITEKGYIKLLEIIGNSLWTICYIKGMGYLFIPSFLLLLFYFIKTLVTFYFW